MQKIDKSVHNAEICLAPRRLDFGSAAGPRRRLPLAFTHYGFFKETEFSAEDKGKGSKQREEGGRKEEE